MNTWKQALWLAKFEMRASVKPFFLLLGFMLLYGTFFSLTIEMHNTLFFDFFFLLVFWIMYYFTRPKEFQLQKISEGVWASPFVLMLNQLPIPKNTLIISRFLVFFIFSLPFHLFILTFIYIFSAGFRGIMPGASYIVFSIIWLCFGIASGSMFPAGDVGDKMPTKKWVFAASAVLFYGAVLGLVIAINLFSGRGIVSWTIYAAGEYPLLSILFSCMVAIVSVIYYMRKMRKKIAQIDYLK